MDTTIPTLVFLTHNLDRFFESVNEGEVGSETQQKGGSEKSDKFRNPGHLVVKCKYTKHLPKK